VNFPAVLPPHAAHARLEVDADVGLRRTAGCGGRRRRPGADVKMRKHRRRDEASARGVDVAVAARGRAMREEALRRDQAGLVLRARHRDIEQPALSSISALSPTARSDGMQPSTTLSTKTFFHSCPLAEWIVDRIR